MHFAERLLPTTIVGLLGYLTKDIRVLCCRQASVSLHSIVMLLLLLLRGDSNVTIDMLYSSTLASFFRGTRSIDMENHSGDC